MRQRAATLLKTMLKNRLLFLIDLISLMLDGRVRLRMGILLVLLTQGMQLRRCRLVLLGMDTEVLSLLGHMCLASVGRTGLQVQLERRVSLGPLRLSSLG